MDLVKHVSARDLTTVLQLKTPNSNRKHNDMTIENLQQQIHQRFKMFQNLQNPEAILAQLGPGHLWLGFSQVDMQRASASEIMNTTPLSP